LEEKEMSKVFIVSAKRTPIGSFLGSLSTVHAAELGATVVKAIVEETNIPVEELDEVIVGNILPAGQGQGMARQVSLGAGIPVEVPAYTVNMVCGSGMKTIMNAYTSIQAGLHNLVMVGGTESMSRAPYIIPERTRGGIKMGQFTVKDHMIDDALMDVFNNYHMGITAENIVEKYNLTREEQDEFAIQSQQKAIKAVDEGRFKDEIVPVSVKMRRETIVVDTDEYPNRRTSLEKLGTLRPAFKKDGSVTAGNASGINDGASFMLVASEAAVQKYNLTPLVEIVGIGQGGVDPSIMGMGPVPAIKNALEHANMTLKEMGLLELNEAFAAQSLGVVKELSAQHDMSVEDIMAKTNVNGGAIALGHPVGSSGNRITTTLIHEMLKQKCTYGLASLCIGGGMGTAIIVKRVEE
jgi:acetyl-CoA C-acetyltransferase